ncbi:MAG: orotate phosphoribosyltransferase, partial [Rhodobacteraceae bacterium]|nr:orotate phosphoribosyltransferase [Paracoccaceae bacterium]
MIPISYPSPDDMARLTARMLLEIQAVHMNVEEPFTLSSGLPSPVYIDCRKLISFPRIRSTLMDFMAVIVMRSAGFEAFDTIAGGETAGIPFAALIAERLALPMTYVRKKPKGYGRNARIEGQMGKGDRVLLVEDLTTDGGSKLSFVNAIRETG